MEVIVVLGSPNFPDGTLGPIAKDRLHGCLSVFDPKKHKIICTGGFGSHFNTSPIAHANYLQRFLIENGVPSTAFLSLALSSNTVEDATFSKSILSKLNYKNLLIITSNYHLDRVKFIFSEVLSGFDLNYIGVNHHSIDDILKPLIQHEKQALDELHVNGLYY
jgi:vancomycin permeability regulator SanA